MLTNKQKCGKKTASWKKLIGVTFGLAAMLTPLTAQATSSSSYEINGSSIALVNNVAIGYTYANSVLYNGTTGGNNTVTVNSGNNNNPYYVFGGLDVQSSGNTVSSINTINMNGGQVEIDQNESYYSGSVTGGLALTNDGNATANTNTVNISGNTTIIEGALTSGWAVVATGTGSATANNNTINMSGGTVSGLFGITAGWAVADQGSATATYNTVNFSGGTFDNSGGSVFAAWSYSTSGAATSNNNTLTMSGGDITSDIGVGAAWAGTYSGSATSSSNTTTMDAGTITGNGVSGGVISGALYGGYAQAVDGSASVTANSNIVTLNTGTLSSTSLVGGAAMFSLDKDSGNSTVTASNNTATMNGGTIDGGSGIYGGWGRVHEGPGHAVVQNNTVNMNSGTLSGGGSVYGGWARVSSLYAANGNTTVSGNTATVNGGTVNDNGGLYGGYAYGYNGIMTVNNNTANLLSGTVDGSVYGGYASLRDADAVDGSQSTANANTANISSSVGSSVYGGYAHSVNTASFTTAANNNTVNINSGSTVIDDIYGGRILATEGTATAAATGNTVNINGGAVEASIYGGHISIANGTAVATGNTININAMATFNATTSAIYGGYADIDTNISSDFATVISGNTLNIITDSISVNSVSNFENYNFLLPETTGKTILSSTTSVALSGDGSAWQSNVSLSGVAGIQPLTAGYTATLINNVDANNDSFKINGQTFDASSNNTIKNVKQGHSLAYNFIISLEGNELHASLASTDISENAKIITASRLASLGLLTQATDFVVTTALSNAHTAANTTANGSFVPFAATNISSLRQNVGSKIDMSGISLLTGISRQTGSVLTGYFIESGWNTYKTHDSYEGGQAVGKGHANYYGLGMLIKKDLAHNYYTEASLRVGRIGAGYDNKDLQEPSGQSPSYHTDSTYYTAHLGLGKKYQLANSNELDIFARYLFTHQTSNSAVIAGDLFEFDALNSHRLQLGAKYLFGAKERTRYYVGLTYEYEFSGTAGAIVYSQGIPTTSLRGSTGILDLGLRFNPGRSTNTTIDIGLQGFTGKRQGVAGNVQFKFGF